MLLWLMNLGFAGGQGIVYTVAPWFRTSNAGLERRTSFAESEIRVSYSNRDIRKSK